MAEYDEFFWRNLKDETLEELEDHGYTIEDIEWVGSVDFEIPIGLFFDLADKEYDAGYGGEEVATDLVVVFNDGAWIERHDYDGQEWWEYKRTPMRPSRVISNAFAVMIGQAPRGGWRRTLAEQNEPILESE